MRRSWPYLLSAAIAAGCGAGSEGTNGPNDAARNEPVIDGAPGSDGSPAPTLGLSIAFDYRFDDAGFFSPDRRTALEAAARVWRLILRDDFEDIPAGTAIRTRDPETPNVMGMNLISDAVIDDVLIFVGCSSFPGSTTASSNSAAAIFAVEDVELRGRLQTRFAGADFEPWTGWISFDCDEPWFFDATPETNDDVPVDAVDFHSVAMHEIGHVLGVGTAEAFAALTDSAGPTFVGPEAVSVHGGPVPLTASGVHLSSELSSGGNSTLMDPSRSVGQRTPPTPLDISLLADLGYEL